MPSSTDPILKLRRLTLGITAAMVALLALAVWWAMRPPALAEAPSLEMGMGQNARSTTEAPSSDAAPVTTGSALDAAVFDVRLWNPTPPPAAPEPKPQPPPPPPPAPPIRLELLAIVTGPDGGLQAALYDPEEDRVVTLALDDEHADVTLAAIDDHGVSLRAADGRERTILLNPEAPAARGGGG